MEEFRQKEIKNIKKIFYVIITLFICIDLGINAYLLYQNYAGLQFDTADNIKKAFIPIAALQILIVLFFTLPIFFLYKKIYNFVSILKNMDQESLMIYKKYTECGFKLYSRVPEYIFFKNELRIATFFSFKNVPYRSIVSLELKTKKYSRGATIYILIIETMSGNIRLKTSIIENRDFAAEQIIIKNPLVFIRN